jgi:pimeloyl-ACP methyl ester carboxylesterase
MNELSKISRESDMPRMHEGRSTMLVVLFGAVALIALSGSATEAGASPRLNLEPCGPQAAGTEALCGTVSVPENFERPEGRRIVLDVVVIPALEGLGSGGALFPLEGGPGVGATVRRSFFLGAGREYRRGRDVVLVNQRGTGDGPHALRCEELERRGAFEDLFPLPAVERCRAELEKRADLTQYGTWNAAEDIDLVRAALGYDRIDLLALSYGTKLGQIYMKRFPERVRSAGLVGSAPLDHKTPLFHAVNAQRALDLIFYECQADADCRAAWPDLRGDWSRLLARLDRRPVRIEATDRGGTRQRIEIHRGPFGEAVRNLIGSAAGQRRLPWMIHQAASGDFAPLLRALPTGPAPYAAGLYLSIECTEGGGRIEPANVTPATAGTFLGDYRVRVQLAACARWPRASLPEGFFTAVSADVPVLMISGDSDHVAPPEWAAEVCAGLPGCRLLRIPHLGHEFFGIPGWSGGECVHRMVSRFYESADTEAVDAGCLREMVPPSFVLRSD